MLSASMKLATRVPTLRRGRPILPPVLGSARSSLLVTSPSVLVANRRSTAGTPLGRYLSATRIPAEKDHDGRGGGPIVSFVESRMMKGQLSGPQLLYDERQLFVAARLDSLRLHLQRSDSDVLPSDQLTADMFTDAEPKGIVHRMVYAARERIGRVVRPNTSPRGIYIHGSVGTGKSFLMDLFCRTVLEDDGATWKGSGSSSMVGRRKIVRWHFHEFMLEVHSRIHQFRQQRRRQQHLASPNKDHDDPVAAVALSFAKEARILCLDEFQVTDIADAMILKRLFTMLWGDSFSRIGMVVVATSNRHPKDLYEGGLNRSLFVPFIDTLHRHMDMIEMNGKQDYRRTSLGSMNAGMDHEQQPSTGPSHPSGQSPPSPALSEPTLLRGQRRQQSYFFPFGSEETRQRLAEIFLADGGGENGGVNEPVQHPNGTRIPVRMGRHVVVPRSNEGKKIGWFDFDSLCGRPLGAADYWAICEHYSTVIVDRVPQLDASKFNEARRFVTLIDALYESRTRLVLAAQVPLDRLLVHFEATVETQDGDEEIAVGPLERPREDPNRDPDDGRRRSAVPAAAVTSDDNRDGETMFVEGKGGSSSSAATTMIRTRDGGSMEWSATGRVGVSLAQLSTVREVSFSFQRAESRLVEMMNAVDWGR
jgi:peroxisome-assembly ATPase